MKGGSTCVLAILQILHVIYRVGIPFAETVDSILICMVEGVVRLFVAYGRGYLWPIFLLCYLPFTHCF